MCRWITVSKSVVNRRNLKTVWVDGTIAKTRIVSAKTRQFVQFLYVFVSAPLIDARVKSAVRIKCTTTTGHMLDAPFFHKYLM